MTLLQLAELVSAALGAAASIKDLTEARRLQDVHAELAASGHDPTASIPAEHELAASQLNARLGNPWQPGSKASWDSDHSN